MRNDSKKMKNVSEIIRAGLRLLEEEENRIRVLKNFIQEGVNSGIAQNFNPQKHLAMLKANYILPSDCSKYY